MKNDLKIFTDGGSRGNPGPAASAFVVYKKGDVLNTGSKYLGIKTNNQAEYTAVILALDWLEGNLQTDIEVINFYLDSELVVRQLTGIYKIKDQQLRELATQIRSKIAKLDRLDFKFVAIPRESNKLADYLVNEALDSRGT